MNAAPRYQPLKAYELTNPGTFSTRHLELRQNGAIILWINTKSGVLQPTQISLHTQSQSGPIVAAARLKKMSSGCRVILGNPDATAKEQWQDVASQSLSSRQYGFQCQGNNFAWKRTHDKELGASGWSSGDYKLVNASQPDQVLAVYITHRKWFNKTDVAKIEFMAKLGQEAELMSLAAMLGIAEHVRRSSNAAAGGAAGGAAAGGGGC